MTTSNTRGGYLSRRRIPEFDDVESHRQYVKQRLASAFRLFAVYAFDEGVAGHITVRDPEFPDTFWVNPFSMDFGDISVSDLIRVGHDGEVVEGDWPVNRAAFAIHSRVHRARPDVHAAAHTHSMNGKTFSALGRLLDPITQDSCAFYEDHALFDDYTGVVFTLEEGDRIAGALGSNKALILRNHGLLTVGESVDSAVWWFIAMDRSCRAQLDAEAAGRTVLIEHQHAKLTHEQVGNEIAGWLSYQPMYERIVAQQPDLLD